VDVGVFEARNRLSELLEAAAQGEEVTILKRGKPFVRIVPAVAPAPDPAERRRFALREARRLADEIAERNGRIFTHEEVISARDEGRR